MDPVDVVHVRTAGLREAHGQAVGRVVELAHAVDGAAAARRVPATPGWTVRELLAHIAGSLSDLVRGRMDGAPGPAWTARHVAERALVTPAALGDEIAHRARRVPDAAFASSSPTPVWDLLVHEADLLEALALPRPPEEEWRPLLERTVGYLGMRGLHHGTVTTTERDWLLGERGSAVRLRADDYELLRVLCSRRSRRQLAGLVDRPEALDRVRLQGPRDVVVPVALLVG